MTSNAALTPASEALSHILEVVLATIRAANNVLIEKDSFKKLSNYLERLVPVLRELIRKNCRDSESLSNAIELLSREVKKAKELLEECSKRSKVYLLVNCRKIVKKLEDTTREISRALSFLPLASLHLSLVVHEEINKLCEDMLNVEFKAAAGGEELMEKIESGIQERKVDRSYANNLMRLIASAVGISTDRVVLKKEFNEFKNDIEEVQSRKDQAEAFQMDQIIKLLENADATSSPKEKEMKYLSKRNSLGSQPFDPLQSFYCPITKDVMVDPVETSTGQTFERSAIQKWILDGNNLCPMTMTPMSPTVLRPNKTLRQSIEEWKDRNTMITIASIKKKIEVGEDQNSLYALGHLLDICEEREVHREWVVLEDYIPLLVSLVGGKNRDIRTRALEVLCILAKDSNDIKDRIAEVDSVFESIVRSLARRVGESKLAVELLLELSKSDVARKHIGKVQGCILLLVTVSSGDDSQAAKDASDLLENLSSIDENVIPMVKANYFKPLLQRLSSGPEDVKMLMASTLADMELSDHGKATLFENGVLVPLLHLVTNGDPEMNKVAAEALKKLSSLPQNGQIMIKEGAVRPLLDQLYRPSSSPKLRELVAATILNLAISTRVHEADQTHLPVLDSDDDTFRLFGLISLTGVDVQKSILQTFYALCESPSATHIRSKLRQCSAIQVLVQHCELDNITTRPDAMQLFCCLIEEGDDNMLSEYIDEKCVKAFIRIIETSKDDKEVSATLGIISNLPIIGHAQITQWLLDAGALPIISKFIKDGDSNGSHKDRLKENAVGSLRRFTVSTNQEWQMRVMAETHIIPVLVELLRTGTTLTKRYSAISLAQFSQSSYSLSKPIKKSGGFFCFSPQPEMCCPAHMGICSVESSFCLVEADALVPLVTVLEDGDSGASEAALQALLTLIEAERLQTGSKVLCQAGAITAIISLLSSPSMHLQDKALQALERIFRLLEYKQKYGASAQMALVDITQRGTISMKSLAGRILGHLNVLPEHSTSYF